MDKATRIALLGQYAKRLCAVQNHPLFVRTDITTFLGFCDTEAEMIAHCERYEAELPVRIAEYEAAKAAKKAASAAKRKATLAAKKRAA